MDDSSFEINNELHLKYKVNSKVELAFCGYIIIDIN